MFDNTVTTALSGLIGWKDHWDLTEIPALSASLTATASGEYYGQYHPALRLDYISAMLPPNRNIEEYLTTTTTEAINQLLNDVTTEKQLGNFGKAIVQNDIIHNLGGWSDTIVNESRFVGVMFRVREDEGLKATINRIGLHLTAAQTDLPIYLYHSHDSGAIATYSFNSTKTNSQTWLAQEVQLHYDNGTHAGGYYYIGYYQDYLTGNAIQYKKLNWLNGYCNTCDGGKRTAEYSKLNKHIEMTGFYVPGPSLPAAGAMFDPEDVVKTYDKNWGFNFNISVGCDLSQFAKDNAISFKKAIGYKVAMQVLQDFKYSGQINHVEDNLKLLIMRDLEGDTETKALPLNAKLAAAIKALNLDHSNLSSYCMPCARKPRVFYGAI
jgi:hypothetical protein